MLTLAQASAWNFGGNRKLFFSSIENKQLAASNLPSSPIVLVILLPSTVATRDEKEAASC
jgi:hypothetical protein